MNKFERIYSRVNESFINDKDFWNSLTEHESEEEIVMLVENLCKEENVESREYWAWMTSVPND